jgi:hypothetical protein
MVRDTFGNLRGLVKRFRRRFCPQLGPSDPGDRPWERRESPGPQHPPEPPRPLKYIWAASVTGALLAELAATSTGPAAEFLRAVLVSAGVPVRVRHVLPSAGVDCSCDPAPAGGAAAGAEGDPGSGPPADQRIPRPTVGP